MNLTRLTFRSTSKLNPLSTPQYNINPSFITNSSQLNHPAFRTQTTQTPQTRSFMSSSRVNNNNNNNTFYNQHGPQLFTRPVVMTPKSPVETLSVIKTPHRSVHTRPISQKIPQMNSTVTLLTNYVNKSPSQGKINSKKNLNFNSQNCSNFHKKLNPLTTSSRGLFYSPGRSRKRIWFSGIWIIPLGFFLYWYFPIWLYTTGYNHFFHLANWIIRFIP